MVVLPTGLPRRPARAAATSRMPRTRRRRAIPSPFVLTRSLLGPGGRVIRVEVPTSRRERARGLGGRRPVPMLFERARSVHTFGMREAIDVAFLDGHHEVIRVSTMPPRRIVFALRARHVLEMPAGTDLRCGDRLAPEIGAR
jgi:uncharacterized membrane protein (UPF0127 family)